MYISENSIFNRPEEQTLKSVRIFLIETMRKNISGNEFSNLQKCFLKRKVIL